MSLLFFNGNGDNLNFKQTNNVWEGELFFPQGSNDIFRSLELYIFEEISEFQYTEPLNLDKFQLFNENRFDIFGSSYATQSITSISTVNNSNNYYSKWVYGTDFEKKYPTGTEIIFNTPLFEFTSPNQSYTVVSTKKGAIQILSNTNNNLFNSLYGTQSSSTYSYASASITGVNGIGIYEYIDNNYNNTLSNWSEPNFYTKYYTGKQLTLVNTSNDGVYAVKNTLRDKTYYRYSYTNSFTSSINIEMELILNTDTPVIYTGNLVFTASNIYYNGIINVRPGTDILIPDSQLNTGALSVAPINSFYSNLLTTYYGVGSQSFWNNNIVECVQAYTWSATSSITPDNTSYWGNPTYINVTSNLSYEVLYNTEIHLTTNMLYYSQTYSISNVTTMASLAANNSEALKTYNIDLYYENNTIYADLIYASNYASINFYINGSPTNSGTMSTILENLVQVSQTLIPEQNTNINTNHIYNIVFTTLDQYGFTITINKVAYTVAIYFVYNGLYIDMPRTIDLTIRKWLKLWQYPLAAYGIIVDGKTTKIYDIFDTINIATYYPNIPLSFLVTVGSNASYYIEHSDIIFYDMNYLNIIINGTAYGQNVIKTNGIANISTALTNWVTKYTNTLALQNIAVVAINNVLYFRIQSQIQPFTYSVNVGVSSLPGIDTYTIVNRAIGHFGALITSNEIVPIGATNSFENYPFATGQIISVNNSIYPYNNTEYNIEYLSTNHIVLSYEGPFWSSFDETAYESAFLSFAFSDGFGGTNSNPIVPTQSQFYSNIINTNSNIVDINYVAPNNRMYVLGDSLTYVDSITATTYNTGLTFSNPIKLSFNNVSNYLYILSNELLIYDVMSEYVVSTFATSSIDVAINTVNGDTYVATSNSLQIISSNNPTFSYVIPLYTTPIQLAYNQVENNMYVGLVDGTIYAINGANRAITASYSVTGLHSMYYVADSGYLYALGAKLNILANGSITNTVALNTDYGLVYNKTTGHIVISDSSGYIITDIYGEPVNVLPSFNYGYLAYSDYDGNIYNSGNNLIIFNERNTYYSATFSKPLKKVIFDQDRDSMFAITNDYVIEISTFVVNNTNNATYSTVYENYYGTLNPFYEAQVGLWLQARQYIRKPRENYSNQPQISYVWNWASDDVPEMFLFDISGDQLPTTGPLAYTGPMPLTTIVLNTVPNTNPAYNALPQYQQTVFTEIVKPLDYIDSETDFNSVPEPLQIFAGYRSDNEGYQTSTLQIFRRTDVSFLITTTSTNYDIVQFLYVSNSVAGSVNQDYGVIALSANSQDTFAGSNLVSGQKIQVFVTDVTNTTNQYISPNNGKYFRIRNVYTRYLIVDFINIITNEYSQIDTTPTTYLSVNIVVVDDLLASIVLYGQTEIEDIRYKTLLTNYGQNIEPEDVYIFKDYEIGEQGIDWTFLNQKRKEMLFVRHDIYNYIGSYKAIINSINYFGYNDLILYEYYRNINISSPNFGQLFKVEIPNIFDGTGNWGVSDFVKSFIPNPNYEVTNLLNLTFDITDEYGNNVLQYSLSEMILKLTGLKQWLKNKVIPLSFDIQDITGRNRLQFNNVINHRAYMTQVISNNQSMTPMDFNLTEAYIMPVNSGSPAYVCHIDFVCQGKVNYFNIKIRTYQTYNEWQPFITYNIGDSVSYYNLLYTSQIDNNVLNNPTQYNYAGDWNMNTDYVNGQFVNYKNDIYEYVGTQSSFIAFGTSSVITPYQVVNSGGFDWLVITIWKQVDLKPVQILTEFRTGTQSYNFTINSGIDPYIVIEVSSDNGYGQNYAFNKNYQIVGVGNNSGYSLPTNSLGPFVPITPVTNQLP